jgi:peroxiredoxin Q/BCP
VRLLAGPLLVIAILAAYVGLLYGGKLPRSLWVAPWPALVAVAAGVALALAAALARRRPAGWVGLGVTVALALVFVVGLPRATRLPPPAPGSLTRGAAAPDFTLPSTSGGELTLSALRGGRVVLVFHRGHW